MEGELISETGNEFQILGPRSVKDTELLYICFMKMRSILRG